jgi:hypothetical protein
MPNFVEKLVEKLREKADSLSETLRKDVNPLEEPLRRLMEQNWHSLPPSKGRRRPAFAVDGSLRRSHLANGAYLFVAQALLIGEVDGRRVEDVAVDVEILRGSTPRSTVERFADLFRQCLEVSLAKENVEKIPEGGVLFLDGALYGQLPQLYPLEIEGYSGKNLPKDILEAYLELFKKCRERGVILISIAKTSREALLSKILQRMEGIEPPLPVPDSEMIYRWTDGKAGYSTPIVLGRRGFGGRTRELLSREEIARAPAIASFFVRLSDFDEALRIDLPAFFLADERCIRDLEDDYISPEVVHPILEVLMSDYGGLEVYNSLLYTVDREVRLDYKTMNEIYLKLVGEELGCEIRLSRSEGRFR